MFERLIESYGRKRSPERAELHYRLARVAKESGDAARAESELDIATKMDLGHAPAMRMLAELCQEQGDLERAERTYRSLLMLVRRKKADELDTIGPSEVFYALSSIAGARGQKGRPTSCSSRRWRPRRRTTPRRAASRRAARTQADRPADALARARMKLALEPAVRAEILDAKAEVLAEAMNKPADALNARLSALELAPESDALHARARALAVAQASLDRYLDRVGAIADEAARKRDNQNQRLAARLLLRMGEAIEQELEDLDGAAGLYARVDRRASTWRWPGWRGRRRRWRGDVGRGYSAACSPDADSRPSDTPRTSAARHTSRWSSSSSKTRHG